MAQVVHDDLLRSGQFAAASRLLDAALATPGYGDWRLSIELALSLTYQGQPELTQRAQTLLDAVTALGVPGQEFYKNLATQLAIEEMPARTPR